MVGDMQRKLKRIVQVRLAGLDHRQAGRQAAACLALCVRSRSRAEPSRAATGGAPARSPSESVGRREYVRGPINRRSTVRNAAVCVAAQRPVGGVHRLACVHYRTVRAVSYPSTEPACDSHVGPTA
jgi:hypothetical protein